MFARSKRAPGYARSPRSARLAAAVCAFVLLSGAASGCSVVNKINNIRHAIDKNRATIQTFSQGLQNSKSAPFQATYVTTGTAPTTIVYAVRPPKDISFSESAGGSSSTKLIANASGEYACSHVSVSAAWTCKRLSTVNAAAQNALFAIYTPRHWVAFLHVFAIGAGLAGDKVTTSTMTVNGFAMNCVDLFARGSGRSTICTTKQNILGYVKVAAQSTVFEIKSYMSSPPASAFQLPAGATVTRQ